MQQSLEELRKEKVSLTPIVWYVVSPVGSYYQCVQRTPHSPSFPAFFLFLILLKEMLERQLEYERVRLEAESKKACLESQEKVSKVIIHHNLSCFIFLLLFSFLSSCQERLRSQLANSLSRGFSRQSSTASTPTHSQVQLSSPSSIPSALFLPSLSFLPSPSSLPSSPSALPPSPSSPGRVRYWRSLWCVR